MNFKELGQFRKNLGMNQTEFWNRLGVTQSAGSRYESGHDIPEPMKSLIVVAYGTPKESDKEVARLRGVAQEKKGGE